MISGPERAPAGEGSKRTGTGWDELAEGPGDVGESSVVKDEEYYRNNPKEFNDLVRDLIELRGGEAFIEEGTWDRATMSHLGPDGVPREHLALIGYARKHPDVFSALVKEYYSLLETKKDAGGEAESEPDEDVAGGAEDVLKRRDSFRRAFNNGINLMATVMARERKKRNGSTERIKRPPKTVAELKREIGSIRVYPDLTKIGNDARESLNNCSSGVRAQVDYLRAGDSLDRAESFLANKEAELKKLSPFAFPWQKRRMERDVLRSTIESARKEIERTKKRCAELGEKVPESLSVEERAKVAEFRELDAMMARANGDLHARGLVGDIKMRERWIRDQEESLKREKNERGMNSPKRKERLAKIAEWRREIADYQEKLFLYRLEHPDFRINPPEKKTPAVTPVVRRMENTADNDDLRMAA